MALLSRHNLDPFFLIHPPKNSNCVADSDPGAPFEMHKIRCPIVPGHKRGVRISDLDVLVPCNPAPDVIFTWMSECLIQERAWKLFVDEKFTGFSIRPAKARIQRDRSPIVVYELLITGWAGVAPMATGIREVERCAGCGHLRYSGIREPSNLIDVQNWDGSDFFMIWPLPRYIFTTGRVVEACKKHAVSGIEFSRSFPTTSGRVIPGYTPGRLSYYMPSDRAHLIGDPLGIA